MKEPTRVVVPPNSKESEMMVLGCMLTSVNSLNIAADVLNGADFYYPEHQIIFNILKTAYKNDKPADVHLVCEELKRQDKLKAVGGPVYVTTLAQYAGTSAFIEEYVEVVQNKAILRRMIQTAQEIEKNAVEDPQDVHSVLDEAQQKLYTISQAVHSQGGILIKDILSGAKATSRIPYLKELQQKQEEFQLKGPEEAGITGLPTHYIDLDKMINGLGPSNLIILAARPAMGKTALALNIAENLCFKSGVPIGVFSLEMTAEQLLHRLICSQSEVESDKLRTGALNGMEFQRVVAAVNAMQKATMVIDDQPGLKITDLRARARRMKETHGIGFLIVDYLQLLSGSGISRSAENRQNEISEISRMLKNLARELNLPVLCLSQLSRKVEERQGHRPMMSDLRESGCLAGDTLIQNAETGELHTITELAERKEQIPFFVFGVDKDLKMGKHLMTKVFYSGKKKIYELKTRTGRSIKASANHPFLKLEGWTRLDQLKKGDRLGLPRQTPLEQIPADSLQDQELILSLQNPSHNKAVLHKSEISRNRMNILGHALGSQELLTVAQSDVYWDEIVSITEMDEEDVYDATVENVHNFVANDFIVHNSIEQDSDVVIFLLRREYYDPYDKPGLAEVIVAKNRHGGVGSVFLTFRKELAQFANYSPSLNSGASSNSNEDAFSAFNPR
jgi:replicative DNA helicase